MGSQVYDVAPEAVRVELLPGQTEAGLAAAEIAGPLLTVSVTTTGLLTQAPLEPTIETVVVTAGQSTGDPDE